MGPTLIGLLQESVVKFASLAALKSPGPNGSFQTVTFAELYNAVKELGTGLISIGLQPHMHVAMLAENNPRWLIADLAILGCAAVDVPVSTRMTDRELEYVIAHADCDLAVVEDATALHRILALRRRLPRLRKVIVIDFAGSKPQAGTGEERVMIYTWDEVLKKGKTRIARGERQFELRGASVTPADTATLLYTSGTTGRPKGVMLSHGSIMHNVTSVHASISPESGTTWLSVLPGLAFLRAHGRVLQPLLRKHHRLLAALGLEDLRRPARAPAQLPRHGARAPGKPGEEHRQEVEYRG